MTTMYYMRTVSGSWMVVGNQYDSLIIAQAQREREKEREHWSNKSDDQRLSLLRVAACRGIEYDGWVPSRMDASFVWPSSTLKTRSVW